MKHGNRFSRCHLAALKQDLVPPDPRLHLIRVSPRELAISLGSLAFMRPDRSIVLRQDSPAGSSSESPGDTDSNNVEDHNHTSSIDRRKTDISLKCTLYKDGEPVADPITVRLNRNNIVGLREVFSCSEDANSHRVKHRHTYHGGSCFRCLSGVNFLRCKLLLRKDKPCVFQVKRRIRYRPKPPTRVDRSTDSSCYSTIAGMVSQFIEPSYTGDNGYTDVVLNRMLRRSCSKCYYRFPLQCDRITIPGIIRIDTILRFQLWSELWKTEPKIVMQNEIYVDDILVAKSELNITPIRKPVNCFVDMFYDETPNNTAETHDCDIRSCCCNFEKRLLCASHLSRMSEEIQRLISVIFSYGNLSLVKMLGRYRYLLYFYLQMLSFSTCGYLQSCGKSLPVAFLTVGVIDFVKGNVGWPSKKGSSCKPIGNPLRSQRKLTLMHSNSKSYDVKTSEASSLKGGSNAVIGTHFERSNGCYQKYKRRVASVYIGPTFKERKLTSVWRIRAPITNIPTYGVPSILAFLVDSDFYNNEYIVCRAMLDTVIIHSSMYKIHDGIKFVPEPPELIFLRVLISTPLYSVGITSDTLDTKEVNTAFGAISYRQINRMMWRYQPLLAKSGETLAPFLRFVDWMSAEDTSRALTVMHKWHDPDFITLMELLSPDFSPPKIPAAVQKYACNLLITKYSVDELAPFFPQLVVAPGAHHLLERLIEHSRKRHGIALHLYWALECWEKSNLPSSQVLSKFIATLEKDDASGGTPILNAIKAQRLLRQRLNFLMRHIKSHANGHAYDQSLKLLEFLRSESKLEVFHGLRPKVGANEDGRITFDLVIPLFTDPSLNITAVDTAFCSIIKTARCPLLLTLHLTDSVPSGIHGRVDGQGSSDAIIPMETPSQTNETGVLVKHIMFKDGDDLRLDQICQQIAKLVDVILRRHGVESYIKCYEVLSTSSKDGFVEFLADTKSISAILREYGSIESFLVEEDTSYLEVLTKKLNFAGSLASYSVLTHLLGVGDRHNDNLILSKSGHVVHVDYGYILGSDPRFLPLPPFKLSSELLDFLGGDDSFFYHMFKERFYHVFSILRRHAKLIITLIYVLANYNLRNVNLSSVVEMESKFMLCTQDQLLLKQHVNELIEASAASLTTMVTEKWHQFSMWWK